jgi:hypothetical protein
VCYGKARQIEGQVEPDHERASLERSLEKNPMDKIAKREQFAPMLRRFYLQNGEFRRRDLSIE